MAQIFRLSTDKNKRILQNKNRKYAFDRLGKKLVAFSQKHINVRIYFCSLSAKKTSLLYEIATT